MSRISLIQAFLILLTCANASKYYDKGTEFESFWNLFSLDVPDLAKIPIAPDCSTCPRIYIPVCATDNKTYVNECRMNCYNRDNGGVRAVRRGPCTIFPDW